MKHLLLTMLTALLMNVHAFANAAPPNNWQQFLQNPEQYELVSAQLRCEILWVKKQGDELKVRYQCMGPEGAREGLFRGHQVTEHHFQGRYYLKSRFGTSNGPLQVSYTPSGEILLQSRQNEYRINLQMVAAQ